MMAKPSPFIGGLTALQLDQTEIWDPRQHTCIPNRVFATIATATVMKDYSNEMGTDSEDVGRTRMELDSHANMPVVGQHSYIINYSGQKVNVRPYTPQYWSMEAELVDAALLYECPYEGKSHILIIRNAIHVNSMEHNLIPPFILREAGLQVNERAKIHTDDPTADDHSIIFPTTNFRIPLQLFGVFSYFSTTKPTENDMLVVEFWGLPPLIPLLQCVNRLGLEVCSVNSCQTEQGSLITLI